LKVVIPGRPAAKINRIDGERLYGFDFHAWDRFKSLLAGGLKRPIRAITIDARTKLCENRGHDTLPKRMVFW